MTHKVLLISGPSASGKTTLGQLLEKYSYKHIDGDTVLKELKTENQDKGIRKKIHWNEIHEDIMKRSLKFLSEQNVVITHVVLPEIIPQYKSFYYDNKIPLEISILMPPKQEILNRNITRTCWKNPTPEFIINTFYYLFSDALVQYDKYFIDNSNMPPTETINTFYIR